MQYQFKVFCGILFLILTSPECVTGQIFSTRADIIKKYGNNYTTGVSDDGFKYLYYTKNINNRPGDSFKQITVYYFVTSKDNTEICHRLKNIDPASQTNFWVKFLKKNYVELSNTMWKDYENNIIYGLDVKDGSCTVQAEFRVD